MTPQAKSATHRTHADAERHPPSLRYSEEVSGSSDRSVRHSAQKAVGVFRSVKLSVGLRSVQLPLLFLRISLRFRWPRRGRQAKWSAPDPGPRSSDDQFIYLACLPAQNIRPSHSPSTWARPAPPRRPGLVLTHRTSLARPIQPTRPVYMTHARSKISRRVCILRGSRTAGGPSRFETQGCAADGTADSPKLCRAATYNIMCE